MFVGNFASGKTVYHGTSGVICDKIRSGGFIPSLEDGQQHTAHGEGVYFSASKDFAAGFAKRAIKTAMKSLYCTAFGGLFCSGGADTLCLISLNISSNDLQWQQRLSSLVPKDHFNFNSNADFVMAPSGRELVFKQQGFKQYAHQQLKFEYYDPANLRGGVTSQTPIAVKTGRLTLSPTVYYDFQGKLHARSLRSLVSKAEKARISEVAVQHWSSVSLLQNPMTYITGATFGAIQAAAGCTDLDWDCANDVSVGLVSGAAGSAGAVVGGAVGGAAGAYTGGYAAAGLMAAAGVVCPWCVPLAVGMGAQFGSTAGAAYGYQLGEQLGRWFAKPTVRLLVKFLKSLFSSHGTEAALRELGFWVYQEPSCKEIRKAHQEQMLLYHPDICAGGDQQHCREKSVRLNWAAERAKATCKDSPTADSHEDFEEL
jgi:hypothetical protein